MTQPLTDIATLQAIQQRLSEGYGLLFESLRLPFLDAQKDFGAVGDGVTDDTTALQAGIDAAIAINGRLFLPALNYRTVQPLNIDGVCTLTGAGARGTGTRGAAILNQTPEATLVLNSGGGAATLHPVIENLSLIGTGGGAEGLRIGQNVVSPKSGSAALRDVSIKGYSVAGIRAVYTAYAHFDHVDVTGCPGDALVLDNQSTNGNNLMDFLACRFTGNSGRGVYIKNGNGITFRSCSAEANGLEGVLVERADDPNLTLRNITFDECYWETNNNLRPNAGVGQAVVTALGTSLPTEIRFKGGKLSSPGAGNYSLYFDKGKIHAENVDVFGGQNYASGSSSLRATILTTDDPVAQWVVGGANSRLLWTVDRDRLHTLYANVGGVPTKVFEIDLLSQAIAFFGAAPSGKHTLPAAATTTATTQALVNAIRQALIDWGMGG